MGKTPQTIVEAAGREVVITNPDKVFFPEAGHTKLDLVRYYLAVAEGALRGIAGRPVVLKRYVNGAAHEPFFQKRAPEQHPGWIETVELRFPSGRTAREIVVRDAAQLLWIVNLGCIDLNPHPVRADDLEHPDELRIDLDPGPGVSWDDLRRVALIVRDVLDEHQLQGWPKTSGTRGMHVNVRIERRWTFAQVRRAALALAREVERRAPELATSKWWKEERRGPPTTRSRPASRRVSPRRDGRPRAPQRKAAVAASRHSRLSPSPKRSTKTMPWRASSAGRHGIRKPPPSCRSTTSSWIRCADAPAPGRASGSTFATFPRISAPRRSPPILTTTPGVAGEPRAGRGAHRRHAPVHRPA